MQVIRKWLNNYFEFSKREFNGLLLLITLVSLVALIPAMYRVLVPLIPPTEEEEAILLNLALNNDKKVDQTQALNQGYAAVSKKRKVALFYFDPNVIDQKGWQQLGLSEKQAGAILNYRANGGVFRKASDLKKMYTISPELYRQMEPFIQIQVLEIKAGFPSDRLVQHPTAKEKILVALNTADTLELVRVQGIGKVFARRIVAYRERIGGFYKMEQLMEVFGIDSLKFQEIESQLIVDPASLKKININTATAADFKRHPYLRYQQINALIEYRKQHGNYSNIADLNKVLIMTPELIEKLAPYLIF